jgi:hypothetical protein
MSEIKRRDDRWIERLTVVLVRKYGKEESAKPLVMASAKLWRWSRKRWQDAMQKSNWDAKGIACWSTERLKRNWKDLQPHQVVLRQMVVEGRSRGRSRCEVAKDEKISKKGKLKSV